jgi:hypothetical protein
MFRILVECTLFHQDLARNNILGLRRNLPTLVDSGDYEIIGDQILSLYDVPPLLELEDNSEDLDIILALLLLKSILVSIC